MLNLPLNLAPFDCWLLRNKAAQRWLVQPGSLGVRMALVIRAHSAS